VNMGFAQVIFESAIDLPTSEGNALTSYQDNKAGNIPDHAGSMAKEDRYIGSEYFAPRKYFLYGHHGGGNRTGTEIYHANDLDVGAQLDLDWDAYIVDKRQFAYFVVIDAWGRGEYYGNPTTLGHTQPCTMGINPLGVQSYPPWVRMHRVTNPALFADGFTDPGCHGAWLESPVMKFRGARLGFESDRVG
jgi:hypothetical protein